MHWRIVKIGLVAEIGLDIPAYCNFILFTFSRPHRILIYFYLALDFRHSFFHLLQVKSHSFLCG